MELLFEILFELIVEGSTEVAKNKKISKWIRYPIIAILSLFIISIIGLITSIGIILLFRNDINQRIAGLLFLIFGVVLIVSAIIKIKKEIKRKKQSVNN